MNTYKKFYFISMQVISLVCSLVFAVAEIYILFAYLFPCLTLIKEYPDVMMDMSVFILLLDTFQVSHIPVTYFYFIILNFNVKS